MFNLFHQTLSVKDQSLRLQCRSPIQEINHVNIFVESWKLESNSAHQATFWLVLILTQYIKLCWNVPLLEVHKFWTFHKIVQRNSQKCFHPPENKRSPANDWEWSTLIKMITLSLALRQHTLYILFSAPYLVCQDLRCCISQQVHNMRFHLIQGLVQALFESNKIHRGLFKLRL